MKMCIMRMLEGTFSLDRAHLGFNIAKIGDIGNSPDGELFWIV